jgi:Zn-dependent M28 family amino/carboxypeptidase
VLFGHDGENRSKPGEDWTFQSDHGSFHKKQIPYVYLGVEDHDDYHRHTDEFEKIDKRFFLHSANLALDVVISMDQMLGAQNEKRSQ